MSVDRGTRKVESKGVVLLPYGLPTKKTLNLLLIPVEAKKHINITLVFTPSLSCRDHASKRPSLPPPRTSFSSSISPHQVVSRPKRVALDSSHGGLSYSKTSGRPRSFWYCSPVWETDPSIFKQFISKTGPYGTFFFLYHHFYFPAY